MAVGGPEQNGKQTFNQSQRRSSAAASVGKCGALSAAPHQHWAA